MHYKFLSSDFLCNVFVINTEGPSTSGATPTEEIQGMPELDETIAVITEPSEEDSPSSSMGHSLGHLRMLPHPKLKVKHKHRRLKRDKSCLGRTGCRRAYAVEKKKLRPGCPELGLEIKKLRKDLLARENDKAKVIILQLINVLTNTL